MAIRSNDGFDGAIRSDECGVQDGAAVKRLFERAAHSSLGLMKAFLTGLCIKSHWLSRWLGLSEFQKRISQHNHQTPETIAPHSHKKSWKYRLCRKLWTTTITARTCFMHVIIKLRRSARVCVTMKLYCSQKWHSELR